MKRFLLVFALLCFALAGAPDGYYDADGSSVPKRDISTNDQNDFDLNEGGNKNQNDQVNQMASQLAEMLNENLQKENKRKKDSLLDTTVASKNNKLAKQNALKKKKAAQFAENQKVNKNKLNLVKNNQNYVDNKNNVAFKNRNDNVDSNFANKQNKNHAQKEYSDNTKKRSSAAHQTATNAFDQDSGFGFQGLKGMAGFVAPQHTSKYSHAQKHKFDNEFADNQHLKKAADSMNNASRKNYKQRKNDTVFNKNNSNKKANKNQLVFNKNNESLQKNRKANKIDQYAQKNLVQQLSTSNLNKVLKKLSTAQLSKLLAAKRNQLQRKNAKARASHNFNQNRKLAKDLDNKSGARKD